MHPVSNDLLVNLLKLRSFTLKFSHVITNNNYVRLTSRTLVNGVIAVKVAQADIVVITFHPQRMCTDDALISSGWETRLGGDTAFTPCLLFESLVDTLLLLLLLCLLSPLLSHPWK